MASQTVFRRPLPMALAPTGETQVTRRLRPMSLVPLVDPDDERYAMIQQTLSLQPQTGSWKLACRHQALMQVSAYHDLRLLHVGYGSFPNTPRTFRGLHTDWIVMDAADDPVTRAYGELIVPASVSDRIDRIAAAGVDFDRLVIAHEVPKKVIGNDGIAPFEALAPPYAAESEERVQHIEATASHFWSGVRSGVELTANAVRATAIPAAKLALAGAAVTAGVAALAAGGVALATLGIIIAIDPILFGVLTDKGAHSDQAASSALYYIGHWCWSEVD